MARGHPRRGMYWLSRMLTVPSAVNLGGSDGKHIGPTTETVRDKQDVSAVSRLDRTIDEVVDTHIDARTFRERHGDDLMTDRQPWVFRA